MTADALAPFLDGLDVVDAGATPATAMAARMLADLGASVRSASAEGIAGADVVITSAGVTSAGGPALARSDAPDAVWVSVTPFGASGPRSEWRASDLGVMAASGNLFATGDPDRQPVRCAGDAAYAHAGPEIVMAVITALASGHRPAEVDVSMQELVSIANMGAAGRYERSGFRGRRAGANVGRTREIWPCADGWVSFGLRGGKARVPSLETIARLVGDPILTERDWGSYDQGAATDEELAAIERALGDWFSKQTMRDLYEIACETNLMLAPVNTPRELYASAQLAARATSSMPMEHPGGGATSGWAAGKRLIRPIPP